MIGDGRSEAGVAVGVAEIRAHNLTQGIAPVYVVEIASENHRAFSGLFNLSPHLGGLGGTETHRFLKFAQEVAANLAHLSFGLSLGYAAVKLLVVISETD